MKKVVDELTDALTNVFIAPLILWPRYGFKDVPEKLRNAIINERLIKLVKGDKNEEATDAEAMAYIMTATFAGPPSRNWGEIYFWLGRKYAETWNNEVSDFLQNDTELDDYQKDLLHRLKRWIHKQQQKYLKDKKRQAARQAKEAGPPVAHIRLDQWFS